MSGPMLKVRLPLVATGLGLAACAGMGTAPGTASEAVGQRTVEVTATYRERILLPPGHRLTVTLADVSLADAPARALAETTIDLEGRAPPYAASLSVPASALDPRHDYAVRAEVRDEAGRLRFTTDSRHAVLTKSAPDRADITMVAVGPRP